MERSGRQGNVSVGSSEERSEPETSICKEQNTDILGLDEITSEALLFRGHMGPPTPDSTVALRWPTALCISRCVRVRSASVGLLTEPRCAGGPIIIFIFVRYAWHSSVFHRGLPSQPSTDMNHGILGTDTRRRRG